MKFYYLESKDNDPHLNLSIEEYLLDNLLGDCCVFYLWQNEKTVVIGKNQEAAAECDLSKMKEEKITLARRCTGGGAVYHDLGNLNFSFLMTNEIYDVKKQLEVIVKALKNCGITAEISGRNDLEAAGAKISGNAFVTRKSHSLHHGTLLISADFSAMGKYLTPSVYKLRKKTISSVKSRVINLSSIKPITVAKLKAALIESFCSTYDCRFEDPDWDFDIDAYLTKHRNEDYLYGIDNIKDHIIEGIFDDSYYKFCFNTQNTRIKDIIIYSDSLNDDIEKLLDKLPNKSNKEIKNILSSCFSTTEAVKLADRFKEALLAKATDIS